MGVDQQVVVEPVDGVVEGGCVKADLHSRNPKRLLQVCEAQPDPGGEAVADALLGTAQPDRVAVRVAKGQADLGSRR